MSKTKSAPAGLSPPTAGAAAAASAQAASAARGGAGSGARRHWVPPFRWKVPAWVYVVVSFAAGIGIWWLVAILLNNQFLPRPPAVVSVTRQDLASGFLAQQVWASLQRVLIGYAIGIAASLPVGFLMAWYLWARRALDPWVQFFRVIPPIALIPIVIVILGPTQQGRIFLIFNATFWTSVIAVYQGVRSTDRTLVNAARVLGANERNIFLRVVIPGAVPFLLTGMRIALGSAWATLVAAELVAANSGLGQMMWQAQASGDNARVIEGLVVLGLLGVIMDRLVVLGDRRLTRWQDKQEDQS